MSAPFPDGLLRWTGDWSPTTLYRYGDIVLASTNVSYVCGVTTSLNQNPVPAPSASWASYPGDSLPPVYQATYYKSANQPLISGATDITFNTLADWNNTGGYITHVSGTPNFTVVQSGLYQLNWNVSILGSTATWTDVLKQISIDITRAPNPEAIFIPQNTSVPTARSYGQTLTAFYYLEAGDIINCRVVNAFISGAAAAVGATNDDLNTWFSWKYI